MSIRALWGIRLGFSLAAVLVFAAPAAAGYDDDPAFAFGLKSVQPASANAGRASSGGNGHIKSLVDRHARSHGVPVNLARAVVRLESNFNPRARGRAGEIGLMQIKPSTARGIGYSGSATALYNPDTNLRWGMAYLATAYKLAGGDVCGTILRYNAGHAARRMNPVSARYCGKVRSLMRKGGSLES
jgi:soluble lytic murein transglycosylase-like protein